MGWGKSGDGAVINGQVELHTNVDVRGGGSSLEFNGGIVTAGGASYNLSQNLQAINNAPIDINNGTFTITSVGNDPAQAAELNAAGNDWGALRLSFGGYVKCGVDNVLPSDVDVRMGWHVVGSSHATLDLNGTNQTVRGLTNDNGATWAHPGAQRTVADTAGGGSLTIAVYTGQE